MYGNAVRNPECKRDNNNNKKSNQHIKLRIHINKNNNNTQHTILKHTTICDLSHLVRESEHKHSIYIQFNGTKATKYI